MVTNWKNTFRKHPPLIAVIISWLLLLGKWIKPVKSQELRIHLDFVRRKLVSHYMGFMEILKGLPETMVTVFLQANGIGTLTMTHVWTTKNKTAPLE